VIRASRRFAAPTLALVVAAAIPVLWFAAAERRRDDCAHPERLFEADRIEGTARSRERTDAYEPHLVQWTDGAIAERDGTHPVRFRIVRSYRPEDFYATPARYFHRYATPEDPTEIRWLEADGERLPVHHRIETSTAAPVLFQYVLIFGGRPVRHVFLSGVAAALSQLRHGTQPVTLLMTFGEDELSSIDAIRRISDAWLRAAWRHYREACG